MDLSHFRFLVDYHFIAPLPGGDGLPYRSSTLGFFLFGCFTVNTWGMLNESRASDLWFLKSAKGVLTVVSIVMVSLLSDVSHLSVDFKLNFLTHWFAIDNVLGCFVKFIRVSGLVFGVEAGPGPTLATKVRVSKSITVAAIPHVRNFDEVKSSKQKIHLQTEK
ncbi:hypothetical protein HID58_093907 [Brassica napus]|nr:hypothetical protein HID58_093907 [Brassica napus]